ALRYGCGGWVDDAGRRQHHAAPPGSLRVDEHGITAGIRTYAPKLGGQIGERQRGDRLAWTVDEPPLSDHRGEAALLIRPVDMAAEDQLDVLGRDCWPFRR